VARNNAANAAWNLAVEQDTNAQHLAWCLQSGSGYSAAECHATYDPGGSIDATANAGAPVQGYATLKAQTQAPAASGGHVTFTSSRGGNALQVGDTWMVSITGASPGKQVTAKVGSDTTPMGTTDSSGAFQLAGTARTADVGAWNESWAVGGLPSGSFSFTVQPAVTPQGQQVINSSGAGSGSGTGGSAAGASASSTVIGGFDLSAIPWYIWVGGAAAAFLAFGKGGR
jgi:hypothetical protein